mgnify:CR=1 FL=1
MSAEAKGPKLKKDGTERKRRANSILLNKQIAGRKSAYLRAVSRTGNITRAADAARISRITHYDWMAGDPGFEPRFEEAMDKYLDSLEREADRRAVAGVRRAIYYQGKVVGYERVWSDTLLMFRLNAERPKKYKYRSEVSGPGGGPIPVVDLSRLSEVELLALRAIRAKLEGAQSLTDGDFRGLKALAGASEEASILDAGVEPPGG